MGFYVNPKNRGFWESIRSKIYVDKTGLISCTNEYINTEQKFICVSRPRRFGKSMALKCLPRTTAVAAIQQICLQVCRSRERRLIGST